MATTGDVDDLGTGEAASPFEMSPYDRSELVGRVERVLNGGAGSLYHLKVGLADKKASLY